MVTPSSPGLPLSIETRLVERVLARRDQTPSARAREAARIFLLDTLGVALCGSRVPLLETLSQTALGWGNGEEARIWGSGRRAPATTAAFLNAWQIHNQEYDCVHEGAVVHPMAVVASTLLAWCEANAVVPGDRLLRAVCISVDVAAAIGMAARNGLRFFRPAMGGALGATAGLASLARLDAEATHSALGITYSQLSGTMQAHVEGSPVLPMQIGFNARAVLTSIELARAGIRGPHDFLTGPFGYFRLMDTDWDERELAARVEQDDHVAELSHKPFPTGRAAHGGVDGVLELKAKHGFDAADVVAVLVKAPPLVLQLVDRPALPDMTASYARLCLPYIAATALLRGSVDVEDFDPAALREAARFELAARVRMQLDDNPSRNTLAPQRVSVELRGGARHEIALPAVLGNPARPLSARQREAKFARCCRAAARPLDDARIAALSAAVHDLEHLPDARSLIDLLVTPAP